VKTPGRLSVVGVKSYLLQLGTIIVGSVVIVVVADRLSLDNALYRWFSRSEAPETLSLALVVSLLASMLALGLGIGHLLRSRHSSEEVLDVLRLSERRYRSIFENAVEGIYEGSTDGHVDAVNLAYASMLGYGSPAQLIEEVHNGRELWADLGDRNRLYEALKAKGFARNFEAEMVRRDGYPLWVTINATAKFDDAGQVIGVQALVEDIGARRILEKEQSLHAAALGEAEKKFRTLVEQLPAMVYISNIDGAQAPHYVSPQFETITGFARQDFIDDPSLGMKLIHPADMDGVLRAWQRTVENGEPFYSEYRITNKQGTEVWVRDEAVLVRDSDGKPLNVQGVSFDITAQKDSENALRVSETNSRALFEHSPLPVWVYDRETLKFLAVNEAAIEHYGYSREEFLGMTVLGIRPASEEERFLATNPPRGANGVASAGEWKHLTKDGTVVDVEVTSHALTYEGHSALLIVCVDVTERKVAEKALEERHQLEESLKHSQKMEAVGRLAGGIAHDFNNLLAVIQNYIQFVMDDTEVESHRKDLTEALDAAHRAGNLVRQLLVFSSKGVTQLEVLRVGTALRGVEQLLRRSIGEDIDLHVLPRDAVNIEIDRAQLEQIVLNLAVNARDAMPHGGKLTITTFEAELDAEACAHEQCSPGKYVCVAVTDTGLGMDEETLASAFEPFFTTKGPGGGTGLGLSTVYGIVRQNGGMIDVDSHPGAGTTLSVYLPVTDRPMEEKSELDTGLDRAHSPLATILVVEDEEGVRKTLQRILVGGGHEVVAAASGLEAVEIIRSGEPELDLVLTDVVMPGMSGRELAEQLKELQPAVPVLFMSGYPDDVMDRYGVLEEARSFLQKPFTGNELLAKICSLIGQKPAA
jgi:PAS domain S-box-containing protein